MRQTTEHRSYVGSEGVSSSLGLSPASHNPDHRSGFTLIEVVVAMSILVVVVLALVSSYYGYYGSVMRERYKTIGENLAQLQLEDIQGMSAGVLKQMVGEGTGDYGYYPYPNPDPSNPSNVSDPRYASDNYRDFSSVSSVFDSGKVSGEFRVYGLTGTGISDLSSASIPGIGVEPGLNLSEYNVILYHNVFPGYQKQVVIEDVSPGVSDLTKKLFRIEVWVYWTANGVERHVTVTGFKNELGST